MVYRPQQGFWVLPFINKKQAFKNNDYFLHQALAHAVIFHERGRFEALQMDAKFISDPLMSLLSTPDHNILFKLNVLKVRYRRYQMSPEMAQGRVFNVETSFLDQLLDDSTTPIALRMSRNALTRFHQVCFNSIRTHDWHLQLLGMEWNQLCHSAAEATAVEGLIRKLQELALVRSNTHC
jgi:hypothetical protein